MKTRALFGLLALLLVSNLGVRASDAEDASDADEYEDVSRAHLVVRKSVKGGDDLQVAGRNVTIVIDIFNAGSA